MRPSPFTYSRLFVFLLGLLLLIIPTCICVQALRSTDSHLALQAATEAQASCQDMLKLLRQNSLPRLLLEERLDSIVTRIGQQYADSTQASTTQRLAHAVQQVLGQEHPLGLPAAVPETGASPATGHPGSSTPVSHLPARTDTDSIFLGLGIWEYQSLSASGDVLLPMRYDGLPDSQREFYNLFVNLCVRGHLAAGGDTPTASFFSNLSQKMNQVFGGQQQGFERFSEFMRGTLVPIQVNGKSCWFFWQTLQNHRNLPLPEAFQDPTVPPSTPPTTFSPDQRRKMLLGGLAAIVPEIPPSEIRPQRVIQVLEENQPAVAFFDQQRRLVAATPSFRQGALLTLLNEQTVTRNLSPESQENVSGWALATGTVIYDQTYETLIASPKPPLPHWWRQKSLFLHALLFIGLLISLVIFSRAVLADGAFMNRLSHQLFVGLLFASLTPLSVIFLLTESRFQHTVEFLERQKRQNLLHDFEQFERGYGLCRSALTEEICTMFRHSEASRLLRDYLRIQTGELQGEHPSHQEVRSSFFNLLGVFFEMKEKATLLRCMPHLVSAVTWGNIGFYANRHGSESADLLPDLLRLIGRNALHDLNPDQHQKATQTSTAPDGQKGSVSDFRDDEIQRFGILVFSSIFGEATVFNLLKSPTDVLSMVLGVGTNDIWQVFCPNDRAPDQAFFLVGNSRDIERFSMRRILHHQKPEHQIFTLRSNRPGYYVIPHDGERYPFLRSMARKVFFTQLPMSPKVEFEGSTYLVEVHPGFRSNHFTLLGVIPFSPILYQEQITQNAIQGSILLIMFLIFFLAIHGAGAFLRPVQTLTQALDQVAQGVYSIRLVADRRDEIGSLFLTFNQMTRNLQERQILGSMVSTSARQAMESAENEARAIEGYRLEAMILFIGIPHFESLRKESHPDRLMADLQLQVAGISRIIHQLGGSIDKIMGEKLLALFPRDRFSTSDELMERVTLALQHLTTIRGTGRLPFPPAIGMQFGQVIAGLLGSGKRRDFTIIGSTVNLAARLETCAEELSAPQIATTDATRNLFGERIQAAALGSLSVKGFQESMHLWQVIPRIAEPDGSTRQPVSVIP